ncbi:sperm mitochondrial-associated cysteine-rich protein-like isoform X1 [Apis cerana]|uniref:sperm mitochondrial-associated cysteine-rich protein-like isoform X1 n=1 Tax=Apis cerana TaxID=7461 RepID=UPI002B23E989|nr:sperm mitochondrial-associated cysteine-rich protein-like isoform X1 [Apis cerana]
MSCSKTQGTWNDLEEMKYLLCAIECCKCPCIPPPPVCSVLLPPRIEELPAYMPVQRPCCPPPVCPPMLRCPSPPPCPVSFTSCAALPPSCRIPIVPSPCIPCPPVCPSRGPPPLRIVPCCPTSLPCYPGEFYHNIYYYIYYFYDKKLSIILIDY